MHALDLGLCYPDGIRFVLRVNKSCFYFLKRFSVWTDCMILYMTRSATITRSNHSLKIKKVKLIELEWVHSCGTLFLILSR